MMTDDELALALARLPADMRAHVRTLMAYGWAMEAERRLAVHLGDALQAKAIIAAMVRRSIAG